MAAPTPKAVAPSGPVNTDNEPRYVWFNNANVLVEPGAPFPTAATAVEEVKEA